MLKFLLALSLLFGPHLGYGFETKAKYAFLMDANTNEVLFEKNADTPITPSSMSKLMTIFIVFEKLKKKEISLSDELYVSERAWRKQGSKMFLPINSRIPLEDLLRGVIIQSGNDACIAIAEGIAGSEEAFADMMNEKASEIGLINSNFKNATGWPDEGHFMTARDIAILSQHLVRDFPEYYSYFSETEFVFNNIKQQNRNMLLGALGVDGLKTGHTDQAGYGIAISALQKDRRLILVVNGLAGTRERAKESELLLQYGFMNFTNLTFAYKDKVIEEIPVWMSKEKTVPLIVKDNVVITLPKSQVSKVKAILRYHSPLAAPIKAGTEIGEIEITLPTQEIKKYPMFAGKDIHKLPFHNRLFRNLDYHLFAK